jgi:outer membrane porin, OprD family
MKGPMEEAAFFHLWSVLGRWSIALVLILIFDRSFCRANPPEYLAATREPADNASELASPFEEVTIQPPGWQLAKTMSEPFFRDSVFSLEPRFYYRNLNDGEGLHEAFAAGGAMLLTTGWWCDTLQLGIAGYTTQPVATHDPGATNLLRPNGDGLSVPGQAWAKLKMGPATATLFRQEIDIPFINGDDARMIPNMFEAYRLDIKPSDIFRFGVAYVSGEKTKTSAEFRPMSQVAGVSGVDRGTTVVGFVLGAQDATYLGAITEMTWDLFNTVYVETGRTWKLSDDFEVRAEAQFVDQQSVGEELLGVFATQLYGASVSGSYRSGVITLAFTSTADGSKILRPFGGTPSFNSLMTSKFDAAGEDSFRVGLSYDFARLGLTGVKAFANFVHGELPAGQHEDEIDVTADYRVADGPLKNIWLRLRYAHNSVSDQAASIDFQLILNYTLAF